MSSKYYVGWGGVGHRQVQFVKSLNRFVHANLFIKYKFMMQNNCLPQSDFSTLKGVIETAA